MAGHPIRTEPVIPAGGTVMAIDPVCGMDVNENNAPAKTEYNDVTYYFCSQNCRDEFEEDPEEYISSAA
jgi:YHS domain-containing protein